MPYANFIRLKLEEIHGYKVITNGDYLTFLHFFSDTDTVKDYSLEELRNHTITEQAFTLYELYGRYYETNVPLTAIDNYLSTLKKQHPKGTLF